MKITVIQSGSVYRADCVELPGSPPIGIGDTDKDAVISLLHTLLVQNSSKNEFQGSLEITMAH